MLEELAFDSLQGWGSSVREFWAEPEGLSLARFLISEARSGHRITPEAANLFRALKSTPLEQVRVVILGQDPYPTPGHATGLAFGVQNSVWPKPPSLKNLFQEIARDLRLPPEKIGVAGTDLTGWARQGVLLLNTVLTVRAGEAGSHQGKGWESFTDRVISEVVRKPDPVVFLLWGKPAQKKKPLILPGQGHLILESAHPSPLSAYRGFFGCSHFSKTNEFLERKAPGTAIRWELTTCS